MAVDFDASDSDNASFNTERMQQEVAFIQNVLSSELSQKSLTQSSVGRFVVKTSSENISLEDAEAEKRALILRNTELRQKLELAQEQERSLLANNEARMDRLQTEHLSVLERYSVSADAEEALAARVRAEQAEWQSELGEFRQALHMEEDIEVLARSRAREEISELRRGNLQLRDELREALRAHSAGLRDLEDRAELRRDLEQELADELHRRRGAADELCAEISACESVTLELHAQLHARPPAADRGAQRDILRLLQRVVQQVSPELQASESAQREAEAEAKQQKAAKEQLEELERSTWHLTKLRETYVSLGAKCQTLEGKLRGRVQKSPRDEVEVELLAARRGDEEIQALHSEVAAAQDRRRRLEKEESRLRQATYQDQAAVQELRGRLRQSEATVARLEARRPRTLAQAVGIPMPDFMTD